MKRPTSVFELRRRIKKRRSELTKQPGSPETMDIGTVDESQPVGARCCVQIRGVLCGRPAEHEATEDLLKAAAAFKRSPRNGKLTWDASLSLIVQKKRWVCGEHEQPAHVILEGDPDAVDEFDVPGDGEAEELRRLAESDDEEDEMDTT